MNKLATVLPPRILENNESFNDKIDKAFDFSRDGDPSQSQGIWDEEIKAFAEAQTLKSLFFSEDWVYIVVDLVAQKLSSVPLRIARRKIVNNDAVFDFVNNHKLNPLIARPNPFQDYHSWMYLYLVEDTLIGNGINWFAPRKFELYILPSDQVSLKFDEQRRLRWYSLSIGQTNDQSGLMLIKDRKNLVNFAASEVIHSRRPNPASLLWGLSPFTPGRKTILFNRYSTDYLNSFYVKQATPAMAITMDRTVNEDMALRQLASFEMAYTGRRNQRRTLLLPKGTDAKPLTHTLADQRLVEMIDKNRETIINLLKIPKHELGLTSAGSLGSEEFKIALRNFWDATLIPIARRVEGCLTMFFRDKGFLKDDEQFKFDTSDVEILKADLLRKAETAEKMAQTLPLNTVLARVWEHEKIDDPRAELPLSIQPKVSVSANEEGDIAESVGGGVSNEKEDNEGDDNDKSAGKAFVKSFISQNKQAIANIMLTLDTEVEEKEDILVETSLDLFSDFAEAAIKLLPKHLADEKGLVLKAKFRNKRALKRAILAAFSEFGDDFVDKLVKVLDATVEAGFDSQLQFILDGEAVEDVQVLRARDEKKRRAILSARGLDTFSGMTKSRTEEIMRQITEGVEKKENVRQITSRIAGVFKDREKMLKRAERIARTETLTAASIGQHAAFLNASEVQPDLQKVWINAGDERVRGNPDGLYPSPPHKFDHWVITLAGERKKKGERFSNGLLYPRDPGSTDPANVINCRCTLALVPPGVSI